MILKPNWKLPVYTDEQIQDISRLAAELHIQYPTAAVLYGRGFRSSVDIRHFLQQDESLLHDPFLLSDMPLAVGRIQTAIEKKENIVIYGDYDVDGVTSVSILYLYLQKQGCTPSYYIPSRLDEGYGVNKTAIQKLSDEGATLIITVDTGTTAIDEVEFAKSLGVDILVTDHHTCYCELPKAVAVVNPMRKDSAYPFPNLAGVGVVFKLLCALEWTKLRKHQTSVTVSDVGRQMMDEYGDLVAIGTIADVMPLLDENRYIVKRGLSVARNTRRPGLAALIDRALGTGKTGVITYGQTLPKTITASHIGFTLAPRINAAGRVSTATKAVELFLTSSQMEGQSIAAELCQLNNQRQAEENHIIEQACDQIEKILRPEDRILVLHHDGWHHGIVGIVASRIMERYHLPTILISFDKNLGKGSGRSVAGLNLVDALSHCEDLLVKFGGHELAAGLTIQRENLSAFQERISSFASKQLKNISADTSYDIDALLDIL